MTHPRTAALVAAGAALLLVTACGADPGRPSATEHDASGGGSTSQESQGGSGGAYDGGAGELPGPGAPRREEAPGQPPAGSDLGTDLGSDVGPDSDKVRPDGDVLSTFALDVDTASYDYARRTLSDGRLPDPAQVRPEEFVNAFAQDYAQPAGEGIGVQADGSMLPTWQDPGRYAAGDDASQRPAVAGDVRLMRVGLQTRAERFGQRQDAHLTFVVDVSGSMREPGRLDLVQDALHTLIDELRGTDSVAIVAYSTTARVIRPMTPVREKADLHRAVDELGTEDSTNLEAGVVTGYEVARAGFREGVANRVILLSDGLANAGSTSHEAILSQVRENAGKDIALLCVGVGREYGDDLMEQLADDGDGFAVYVDHEEQARRLFVEQLPGTLAVRARDAKVQVAFDRSSVATYRLIGFENRTVADEDFRNNAADGGEVGPGHSVTAMYVVTLRPGAAGTVATATARWQSPRTGVADEARAVVDVADLAGAYASAAPRMRLDYVAAAFADYLRGGLPAGTLPLDRLAAEADALALTTEDRDVRTLAGLIRRAGELV